MFSTFLIASLSILSTLSTQSHCSLLGVNHGELKKLFAEFDVIEPSVVSVEGHHISHDLSRAQYRTEQYHSSKRVQKRRKRSPEEVDIIEVTFAGEKNIQRHNNSIDVRGDMHRMSNDFDAPTVENFTSGRPVSHSSFETRTNHIRHRYLYFNVSAFKKNLRLCVESKSTLIAPGAKSVLFTSDGRIIEKDLSSSCLYVGKIIHYEGSKVAVSNCNGLAGLIQIGNDEFFIEPIDHIKNNERPQRHVIYKRSIKSENVGKRMEKMSQNDTNTMEVDKHLPLLDSLDSLIKEQVSDFGGRAKRSANSRNYNIEILLTVGSEVVLFHGEDHVENYLLTLMNIVDEIYHDHSLGENVNIVLSRLYQLDQSRTRNLIKHANPAVSLKNVCRWAYRMYENDPPPEGRTRPDHYIFLTRKNFGPAGYAHVSGMCQLQRSCSLNFEDGFSSAFVVAHETGHVLGMEHDGEGNKCGDETSMGSIMAPLVQAAFNRYHWSRCSQQELRRNLPAYDCLLDDPHSPDWGPIPEYPGVTYSMDDQCRFDFGQGYRRCTAFRNMDECRTLWCSHDDNPLFCKTKKGPPIDGTKCGDNMWCFKSHCVWRSQQQEIVNGNWGPWSAYTECSRSCGTGVMYRSRLCNNPEPSLGGSGCAGLDVGYDLCNKRPCPKGRDFRADQCMYNNEVEFNSKRHKWLPYEPPSVDLKCDLYCVSKKTGDVVTMGEYVADGTLCSYDDPHGICIRRTCVNVGCDRVLGSTLREDACGVCGGDGSKCQNISLKVTKKINRKLNAYVKLLTLPNGARHVRISELPGSGNGNLLALKSRANKHYFLNAKSSTIAEAQTPKQVINFGIMWIYENLNGTEQLSVRGPLITDVYLMALVRQRNVKLTIQYSYVLHVKDLPKTHDNYRYEIRHWSSCSVTCGSGVRRAKYGCKDLKKNKWVKKGKCKRKSGRSKKRNPSIQPCTVKCRAPARWVTGEWAECSKSCGSDGRQERYVNCQQANSRGETEVVDNRLCLAEQAPPSSRTCNMQQCPPQWKTGPWSPCSITCGEGTQRRQVSCRTVERVANASECFGEEPRKIQQCHSTPCPENEINSSDSSIEISTIASPTSEATRKFLRFQSNASISNNCDEPIFCNAMVQYCKIQSFRKMCCQSCGRYSSSEQEGSKGLAGETSLDLEMDINETMKRSNFSQSDLSSKTFNSSSNTNRHSSISTTFSSTVTDGISETTEKRQSSNRRSRVKRSSGVALKLFKNQQNFFRKGNKWKSSYNRCESDLILRSDARVCMVRHRNRRKFLPTSH